MKKTFLILFLAIFATLLSGCEKSPSIDTFNTLIEEAIEGGISLQDKKEYIDGTLHWAYDPNQMGLSMYSRMSQDGVLLFYSDGTCRKCYTDLLSKDVQYFYRTLYWEADAERRVIRLTDKALQEAGAKFAVTELKLTSRSGNNLGFRGLIPTVAYSENTEVYFELSGTLLDAAKRMEAESLYRSDTEDPLLK